MSAKCEMPTFRQWSQIKARRIQQGTGDPSITIKECLDCVHYSDWWEEVVAYVRAGGNLTPAFLNTLSDHPYNYRKLALDCHPIDPLPAGYVIPHCRQSA